jgi:hypothetical protein
MGRYGRWAWIGLSFLVALAAGYVVASVLHTQFVLARLLGVGARIGPADWLATTAGDVVGFFPAYPLVLGLALACGFAVARLLLRWLRPLAPVAYPLAGFLAVAAALWLMRLQMEITPIAGARGLLGFLAQCAAGALAGWLFARLTKSQRRAG